MSSSTKRAWLRGLDTPLTAIGLAVLLICGWYAAAYAFWIPDPGIDWNGDWEILRFTHTCQMDPGWCTANQDSLHLGDRLVQVGSVSVQEFSLDARRIPFMGFNPGEMVPVTFIRDGVEQQAMWLLPGPALQPRLIRLSGLLFVLPFWLAGSAVLIFLRPRDLRWLLLVLFNYVTALWLVAGFVSAARVPLATETLRITALLMVPVYLHLHLRVPTALNPGVSRILVPALYGAAVVLAGVEIWRPLPSAYFYLASLLAIVGSVALLIYRSIRQAPAGDRLATRLMLMGVSLGFLPGILLWVVPGLAGFSTPSSVLIGITTLAIPLAPCFYVYALYKRSLGNLEFRANRVLSYYSFILLFGTAFVTAFLTGGEWVGVTPQGVAFALLVSTVFIAVALWLQKPFQRFIDRLAYGTEHNAETIIRTFANEIPRALEHDALIDMLSHEVAPALLIRQSALYLMTEETAPLYSEGVPAYEQPDLPQQLHDLLNRAGRYLAPDAFASGSLFAWVRLVIPIELTGKLNAVWLLGRRDPDDYYARPDIELLSTLGNQIGVALETARLFQNLQRRATELETAYRDLQRLDRLKDEFVQNVSHELRTPLTFVRGYADLMLEQLLGPLTDEQRDALQTMSDRTEGIIRMVNDIISLQHASVEELIHEPVNLEVLAHSCLEAVEITTRRRANGQPIPNFKLFVADNVPQIMGDRRRLAQVIDNLLGNAVKFSPDGGQVSITILPDVLHTDAGAAPQPAVRLDVCDQGIGIPEGELERIWQRFYQVDGSSTRRFGGMGLGLAIVRGIVIAHGGQIWADSRLGHGSVFHVLLPVTPPAPETAGAGLALAGLPA